MHNSLLQAPELIHNTCVHTHMLPYALPCLEPVSHILCGFLSFHPDPDLPPTRTYISPCSSQIISPRGSLGGQAASTTGVCLTPALLPGSGTVGSQEFFPASQARPRDFPPYSRDFLQSRASYKISYMVRN